MAKCKCMESVEEHAPHKRRRIEVGLVQHELPRDVLFQILSRLPEVKLLIRCKLVCKSWFSVIRDPLFARAHQTIHKKNQHNTTNLFLSCRNIFTKQPNHLFSVQVIEVKHDESGNLTATPLKCRWYPFHSCNFSLSAGIVRSYSIFDDRPEPVHIFNPSIREVLGLPMQFLLKMVSLGFSSLTNEYKILRGRRAQSFGGGYELQILSLGGGGGGGTWRDLPEIDYQELGLDQGLLDFSKCSLCFNGALHWIQFATNKRPILLAFDIRPEIFRVIPYPQDYNKVVFCKTRVIQVNGCLAVFDLKVRGNDTTTMDFWILKDYRNQVWFKDSIIFTVPWWKFGEPLPVGSIHTGELLLAPSRNPYDNKHYVHLYDMRHKTYNKTEIVLPNGSVISAVGYDETIFPLKQ